MRHVTTQEETAPLDAILTKALSDAMPPGTKVETMSFREKVGTIILLKTIKHLAGPTLDFQTRMAMAMLYAVLGASTGMQPTASSVEMLNKEN